MSKDSIFAKEVIRAKGSETLLEERLDLRGGVDVPFPGTVPEGVSSGVGSVTLNETPFSGLSVRSFSTCLEICRSTSFRSGGEEDLGSTGSLGGNGVEVSEGDCLNGEAILLGGGEPVPSEHDMAKVYTVACRALQNR